MKSTLKVSIGLPVYNGEKYLRETIESILNQTFRDFELIISDNASTDRTQSICREYERMDSRVTYHRSEHNLGAAKNYNLLVGLARGEYFKWAAADDILESAFLEQCVPVLDSDQSIVIAHTRVNLIDENGACIRDYDDQLHYVQDLAEQRFNAYLSRTVGMWNAVCGVIRKSVLVETKLIEPYISSDQVLVGHLIMKGKVYQCKERLFKRRMHDEQAGGAYKSGKQKKSITLWFDPSLEGKLILPKYLKHYFAYIPKIISSNNSASSKVMMINCLNKWLFQKYIGIRVHRKLGRIRTVLSS